MFRQWLQSLVQPCAGCTVLLSIFIWDQTVSPSLAQSRTSPASYAFGGAERVVQFPTEPSEQIRLCSTAPLMVVARLYWLCEPTLGGDEEEAGGRLLDQVAMYSTVDVLKGRQVRSNVAGISSSRPARIQRSIWWS